MQQQDAGRQHFFVHDRVAVVVRILEDSAAIFQRTIQFKVPVILRFVEHEISTIASAAPSLFHHVDIAIATKVIGGITGTFNKVS